MEVLFTSLAERYERRSVVITGNLVFSEWDRIFKDPMTTDAAIDRPVHHSTVLELNGESIAPRRLSEPNRQEGRRRQLQPGRGDSHEPGWGDVIVVDGSL